MTAETKKRPGVCDILILAVTAAMMIGARTWFAPCDHLTESGGYMACHWAGEALKAASLLALCLAAAHLVPSGGVKAGLDIALIGLGALTACLPGGVISLCMNADMTCRAVTRPWALILGAALALLSAADIILAASRASNARHARSTVRPGA